MIHLEWWQIKFDYALDLQHLKTHQILKLILRMRYLETCSKYYKKTSLSGQVADDSMADDSTLP